MVDFVNVEGFFGTLLSWFSFLTCCSIFIFLVYRASETWVGALLEKRFLAHFKFQEKCNLM